MKHSSIKFERLMGERTKARRKSRARLHFEQFIEEPIIRREIHGERVYVPLRLQQIWNEV
ncbi:hypothetical protein [Neobacillus rhizophilus]|uniref:Uncharacterized protein n=1 Tax=Neobacillus rhizophilus TaxID=2833579 RepID=A0A942YWF8_9BACI|nr:hypothetical protein [Neobacillus rhizophilus]MBS4212641.1 hypothetical protein [Neobacillus rhizophilus]